MTTNTEYVTIKIPKKVYEALKELRVPRPDIGNNVYEKTFAVVLTDLIKSKEQRKL